MKHFLRRSDLERSREARKAWLLVLALGLFSFFHFTAQGQTSTKASLSTSHNGPWFNLNEQNKAGWSQSDLDLDPYYTNLNTDDSNTDDTGVASFTNIGAILQIDIAENDSPQLLTFLINASSAFKGSFVIEGATANGGFTAMQEFNDIAGGSLETSPSISITPNKDIRRIRFRLAGNTSGSSVYIDRITVSKRETTPSITVLHNGASISNNSTYLFTDQNINTESAPVTFTIRNTGSADLSLPDGVYFTNQEPANQFRIVEAPATTTLAPDQETTFKVAFKPTSPLTKKASLTINSNDANNGTFTLNLSGNGHILPAVITSFTPTQGAAGTTVEIYGSNLINTEEVLFYNTKSAVFSIVSDSRLTVTVPSGVTTGKITIKNNQGGNVTTSNEDFKAPPSITSVSPAKAPIGYLIDVTGSNFSTLQSITLNNQEATQITFKSNTLLRFKVPVGATLGEGKLIISTQEGVTETTFTVTPAPTITSFTPAQGQSNTTVTVTGTNFPSTSRFRFKNQAGDGYVNANTVTRSTDGTTLTGTVPSTAGSGTIVIVDPTLTIFAESSTPFTVVSPVPTISSISPESGQIGTLVTINGTNLNGVQSITFNGTPAPSGSYSESSTKISVYVPTGATSGPLVVTTTNGSAETTFTVIVPAPSISSMSSSSGPAGTLISVKGTALKNITSLTFNGSPATFTETADGFDTEVPSQAPKGQGLMTVKTAGGTVEEPFEVLEPTPLPVVLVEFAGKTSSNGILLTWKTASEQDNAYFEVQSSSNPATEEFKTIQRVNSKVTNSQILTSYSTTDRTATTGSVTYYRLKQVDLDGASELSKIIAVENKATTKMASPVKVYPNPFVDNLSIEVDTEKAGKLNVVLYYVTGKKAYEQAIEIESGVSTIELPFSNMPLSSGMYILSTEINGLVSTARVIKK